jgi:sugar lactone lactonase YvrE
MLEAALPRILNIARRFHLSLVVTTVFLSVLGMASAATAWIALQPSGTPPAPRTDSSAVYIAKANQMVVFGGNPAGCTSAPSLNDIWVLSAANGLRGTPAWTQLFPAGSVPPARRGHSAVYNPATDRMIVFGGDALGCSAQKYNDVWVLDHASGAGGTPTWIMLTPAGIAPPARSEHVAIYDQANDRMIIFGGDRAPQADLADLWVLSHADGAGGTPEWEDLTPPGPGPSATGYAAGTYDPATNRMTLFGGWICCAGPGSNQVWTLAYANGMGGTAQWTQLAPSGTLPTPRVGARGTYNQATNSATYFGGSGTNQLWQLSHANGTSQASWTKLAPSGTAPAGRGGVAANPVMVYDPGSGREIIFGGKGAAGVFNDTWILAPGKPASGSNIYVLDTDNHRVQQFNATGVYQSQFSQSFDLPTGIALDTGGNVYVKDGNHNCSADKFDGNGNFLLQFGTCSVSGIGPGIFDNTGRIATDASGSVWVTSPDFYYAQKFDSRGHYLSMVCMANVGVSGCPPATPFPVQPQGIAIDAAGDIYMTNVCPLSGGFNVVKFSSSGSYLSSFGSAGSGNGQFNDPEGIAIDAGGSIYVADSGNNRIQRFDSNGVYQGQFGSAGSGNGQFNAPVGIAIDASGNIYVTDVGNNRVQKFNSSEVYQSQFGSAGAGNGQFNAPYGIAIGK